MNIKIGAIIKKLRAENNITQDTLATAIGVKSYINNHGKYYTSVITDKLIYLEPDKDFHEHKEHTDCYYMLDRLQNKRYNCIRRTPRFVSIIERLKEHSK